MDFLEQTISDILVERLGLPSDAVPNAATASLFAPVSAGGLELDSLSTLEIIAALSDRFNLPMDDIAPEDFLNIAALADYLRRQGISEHAQTQ